MPTLTIRGARADDHGTFAKLVHELGVDDPVPTPERFAGEMIRTMLIAERDGCSVGYAFFRPMKEVVHLAHLVAAPEARREGVGRALMTEVVRRGRQAGCAAMTLNVFSTNVAALHLYESFGLTKVHTNIGLKVAWALVDALTDADAPFAHLAREITPDEDEALEGEWSLPKGLLADQRARPGRVLRTIATGAGSRASLGVFDPGFPGTYPFRAAETAHALSLLRAFRPFARPEDDVVNMLVENQPELAQGLIRAGATKRLETVLMRGPI
jgi:GNAT superfamily N-acetyltransferase